MKKAGILMTVLILSLAALTGCGCRNSKPMSTTAPTTVPTVTTTPTAESTAPTAAATEDTTSPTIQDGNGPLSTEDDMMTDEAAGENSRGMAGSGTAAGRSGITGSIE